MNTPQTPRPPSLIRLLRCGAVAAAILLTMTLHAPAAAASTKPDSMAYTSVAQFSAWASLGYRSTQAVTFSPGSFFTSDISRAPLDRNSSRYVQHLLPQIQGYYGGNAAFNAYQYNAAFYRVTPATPRIALGYWNCQNKRYLPQGLFDGPKHFENVPVPGDAIPTRGNDASLTIYDATSDQLWELWKLRRNPSTQRWEACWGGRIDHVSRSQGTFSDGFGASASGISMAGGMITIDEVRRGSINHAMYLGIREPAHWTKVSWPAQRSDGHSTHPYALREGMRLRLDPNLDLRRYRLSPVGMMVARAAQKYGFYVADRSGAVAVITESGDHAVARTGGNPWDELLGMPSYRVLSNFPWHKLQVLPVDYGKP